VYETVIGENTDRLMDLNSLSVSILAWDQSSSYTAFSTSSKITGSENIFL
jgi:hypothetical protein